MDLKREDWSAFKTYMSVQKPTFEDEEYEMAVDGAHNDVLIARLIAINDNKEVEIVECQVSV